MQPSGAPQCPKCAAEVRDGWRVCPNCAAPLKPEAETRTIFGEHSSSGSSVEEGRFPAGTVLAGRYRVLGLIGQGGMGEVYRAYDIILNQPVALKFLGRANMSEAALARFRNEVRIARQVSHPNVCRVYDIGFIEGFHFLSMEYLDGEDLASLIRRIGRLPQDKAIEFTRKICAGLAAAHERGVLHRDLKPANIMIDGRGHVRITDFGLAALAQEVALGDIRSGTPAYMSPEQKAGREVTIRSDIYSLGLTLHEMFTGKRRSETQSNPSEIVKDLDPAVERVILRCLEEDPKRRPSTALSVAMALPGGDPIAAALAAGETPSPEMVAASHEKEGFSNRTATLCFGAAAIGLILTALFLGRTNLLSRTPLDLPPDALALRAQQILAQLGYSEKPKAAAYGFDFFNADYPSYLLRHHPRDRDALLATGRPVVTGFWYRQHKDAIVADSFFVNLSPGSVNYDSPPNTEPGMVRMILDGAGHLYTLEARPAASNINSSAPPPDWSVFFTASGLDPARFIPAPPEAIPPMAIDARMAWTGAFAEGRTEKVRIEAASWQGKPVYFNITGDWQESVQELRGDYIQLVILVVILCIVGFVAWKNLRLGRCDRRGAFQLAVLIFLLSMAQWALSAEHIARPVEIALAIMGISWALFVAALIWLLYVAIEPYVRRHWPDALISWTRLQAGKARDPLVASHALAGLAGGGVIGVVALGGNLAGNRFWGPWTLGTPLGPTAPNSAALFVAGLCLTTVFTIFITIGFLFIVVLLRLVIRKVTIADLLGSVLFGASNLRPGAGAPEIVWTVLSGTLAYYAMVWLLRRFGLLATLAYVVGLLLLQIVPLILPSWYSGRAAVAIAIPIAMAAWALWVILSAQRRPGTESAA